MSPRDVDPIAVALWIIVPLLTLGAWAWILARFLRAVLAGFTL